MNIKGDSHEEVNLDDSRVVGAVFGIHNGHFYSTPETHSQIIFGEEERLQAQEGLSKRTTARKMDREMYQLEVERLPGVSTGSQRPELTQRNDLTAEEFSLISDYSCMFRVGKLQRSQQTPQKLNGEFFASFDADNQEFLFYDLEIEKEQRRKRLELEQIATQIVHENQVNLNAQVMGSFKEQGPSQPNSVHQSQALQQYQQQPNSVNQSQRLDPATYEPSEDIGFFAREMEAPQQPCEVYIETELKFLSHYSRGIYVMEALAALVSKQKLLRIRIYRDLTTYRHQLSINQQIRNKSYQGFFAPLLDNYNLTNKILALDVGDIDLRSYRLARNAANEPLRDAEVFYVLERLVSVMQKLDQHQMYLSNLNESEVILRARDPSPYAGTTAQNQSYSYTTNLTSLSSSLYEVCFSGTDYLYFYKIKQPYPRFYTPAYCDPLVLRQLKACDSSKLKIRQIIQNEFFFVFRLVQRLIVQSDEQFLLESY